MKKATKYILGVLVLATILVWSNLAKSPAAELDKNVHIYFLNVGQGDSEMIEQGNYQILIDGGPDDKVLSELGQVMPNYDRKIEAIILTHPDADHLTGLREVIKRYEIGKIYYSNVNDETAGYADFKNTIKTKDLSAIIPKIGESFTPFADGTFTFLWPGNQFDSKNAPNDNMNNTSEVTKFCYFSHCVLFTGDIQTDEQKTMFGYYSSNNIFNSELLKIPHHGSVNGTDQILLDQTKPKYAVIEVGADNKYGHPHAATIDLLQKNNIQYFRTDQDETIEFDFTKDGIIKK